MATLHRTVDEAIEASGVSRETAAMMSVGNAAALVDVMNGALASTYGESIAMGVAYGVVLAMRHPEYAQLIYADMVREAGEYWEGSAMVGVVDGVTRQIPLSREDRDAQAG